MADKPKALPGDVPPIELVFEDGEVLEFRAHEWDRGPSVAPRAPTRMGAMPWLNMPATHYNRVKPRCHACGAIELRRGDPKAPVGTRESMWWYEDDGGKQLFSNIELSCPGPGKSLTGEAMERARRNKVEIRNTNEHVHRVERQQYALAAAMEARITQLEAENRALREQVGSVSQIDLGQLAAKLFELAEAAKARKALESVESKGRVVQIPKELADVIDVVGIPIEGEVVEDDEDS